MAMILANDEADYAIKPEVATPSLETSQWPLLLKGYDRRELSLSLSAALSLSFAGALSLPSEALHANIGQSASGPVTSLPYRTAAPH